jgi:DNA-directed RNA polymerase alpha subunit
MKAPDDWAYAKPRLRWAAAAKMRADGLTYAEIGSKMGVTGQTIKQHISKHERFTERDKRRSSPVGIGDFVEALGLGVRASNALANAEIVTVGDLCNRSRGQLLKLKNCGRECVAEIEDLLATRGYHLTGGRAEPEDALHKYTLGRLLSKRDRLRGELVLVEERIAALKDSKK